jgi:hypothetical protein
MEIENVHTCVRVCMVEYHLVFKMLLRYKNDTQKSMFSNILQNILTLMMTWKSHNPVTKRQILSDSLERDA